MITQLDNLFQPLMDMCRDEFGDTPVVTLEYCSPGYIRVTISTMGESNCNSYDNEFENLKAQFDDFVTKCKHHRNGRPTNVGYFSSMFARSLDEIDEELTRCAATEPRVYQREFNGGVNVTPGYINIIREEIEW